MYSYLMLRRLGKYKDLLRYPNHVVASRDSDFQFVKFFIRINLVVCWTRKLQVADLQIAHL